MRCATVLGGYPPEGVRGTVRALWAAREAALAQAFAQARPAAGVPGHRPALRGAPAGARVRHVVRAVPVPFSASSAYTHRSLLHA